MPNITIQGLDELSRKLNSLTDFQDIVEPPLVRAAQRIQRYMADYPPQRNRLSSYVRTGTLGRRWTTSRPKRTFQGVEVSVGNNTEYGPFVQSKRFQARMHRNWWQTDEDAVRTLIPAIQRDFEQAIEWEMAK